MSRRYLGLTILAAMALGAAPAALRAADHRYFVISANDTIAAVVDLSARTRAGDIVSLDLMLLRPKPVKIGGLDAYWADGVQEFDCAGHRSRTMLIAGLTLDREQKANQPGASFQPWSANAPGSGIRKAEDFVCRNIADPAVQPVGDLGAFQRSYLRGGPAAVATARSEPPDRGQASIPGPLARPQASAPVPPVRPQGPITAPSGAGMAPPTVATAAYYMIGKSADSTLFLRPSGALVAGGQVDVPMTTLMDKPVSMEGGMLVAWGDGDVRIDCRQHRWRMAMSKVANLDRSRFETVPEDRYSDWTPILPGSGMEGGEALMCNNRIAPGVVAVDDLVVYGRRQFAGAGSPPRGPASAPPSPSSSPSSAKPDYRMAEVSKDGALVIDRASFKRQQDTVAIAELSMFAEPEKIEGGEYWWAEVTVEVDCVGHRYRQRIDGVMTKDRLRRRPTVQPKFSTWSPVVRATLQSMVEDYACRGRGAENFDAVPDLDQFQSQVLAAIKGGAFKR